MHAKVTKMDVKNTPPRVTEGEEQMRKANSQYFESLRRKREFATKESKQQAQLEKKRIAFLERKKAAREKAKKSRCDSHEKKIAYYESKLRQGYNSTQGARYHRKKYEHEAEYRQHCR